jgi:hypothetical protein
LRATMRITPFGRWSASLRILTSNGRQRARRIGKRDRTIGRKLATNPKHCTARRRFFGLPSWHSHENEDNNNDMGTLRSAIVVLLGLVTISGAIAHPPSQQQARSKLIDLSGAALLDQIKCQHSPQVAHAINAMLENRLIRYADNENGIYLFAPTAPLTLLGLRITHISGFDGAEEFKGVPPSRMVGTAPPTFLEVDVAAPTGELRMWALKSGLVEAVPHKRKTGFEVSATSSNRALGSYLAPKSATETSSIQCVNY